ncbi:hypothetical protein [Ramlibacter albus]|uniref:Uncharacterized protein n=1 Tax=Ramlibacter albus TaxID=2079448 RepID=A0A923MBX2_9BURK|nr:hypothetical protein [Ramlibacter albus]MBC5766573.1 hypothetical protein [Ramlibacter albus]
MPAGRHYFIPFALALALATGAARAEESRHLAPGFQQLPAQSKLVIVPAEMELFSISAGGVQEPRADWTEAAQKHFKAALMARKAKLGSDVVEMSEREVDDFAQVLALHGNVASSIFYHHAGNGPKLPTKDGKLDWTLGEAVKPIRDRTGADYALFTWIRDSYASGERKAAIVAMALLGSINLGGEQVGYASLVDLKTGRVVWFNDLQRFIGDLREAKPAEETVDSLLKGFPGVAK